MSFISPVSAVQPARPVIEAGGIEWLRPAASPRDIAPFWRDLSRNLLSASSEEAKFHVLAELAANATKLPEAPEAELPQTVLRMREDEIRDWANGQPPDVRGRFYRMMHGANVAAPWPYHLLQSGGRFGVRWKRAMCNAARRYVNALAADAGAVALLRAVLDKLPAGERRTLIERMTARACAAWGAAMPALIVNDSDRDGNVHQAAETTFKTEAVIEFFPWAFAQGAIELIAVVFHEVTHLVQMYRLDEDKIRQGALAREALEAIDDDHTELLRLSFAFSGEIGGKRYGNYYYLYRFETEVEREAHLAGLEAALLAAGRPEFNPAQSGTMTALTGQAEQARQRMEDYDPNLVAQAYMEEKTGLRIAEMCTLAARAADEFAQHVPTLYALEARQAANPAAVRLASLTIGAGLSLTMMSSIRRQRDELLSEPAAARSDVAMRRNPAPVQSPRQPLSAAWIWDALRKLEQLRDGLDRSGMLAQALMSSAPKALYGVSEESRFLYALFQNLLDPDGLTLAEFARRHMEKHFGCVPPGSSMQRGIDALASALRAARARYRSPLSRQILLEAACGLIGGCGPDARDILRRAVGAMHPPSKSS